MDVLEQIKGQLAAVKLPLYAVTLTAVPCPDTPVLLMLHWHGFRRDFLYQGPATQLADGSIHASREAQPVAYRSVPVSALQLNEQWEQLQTLDLAAMEAGWELGAWDVARMQHRSCMRPGADPSEAWECLQAFGNVPESLGGRDLIVSEAPDADELLKLGAQVGYVTWQFRPVCGGIWADVTDDVTLNPDGTREPSCPYMPDIADMPVDRPSRTVYRFGHSEGITLN